MNEVEHVDWQHTYPSAKAIKAYVPSPQEFRSLEGENKQLKELLGEKDLGSLYYVTC
ncbi:hypothetical protein ACQKLN_24910 [Paenibacillus glucanolyticus]|uniref:hypothetical protein n=1 Tax=Paenibacillus glucanolyticus TaxID=59843 RepID=UPI00368EF1DE